MRHRCRLACILLVVSPLVMALTPTTANTAMAGPQPAMPSDPIKDAAAFIGMPATALVGAMANQARVTGGLGAKVALDGLDAALVTKLILAGPGTDAGNVLAVRALIESHRDIRDGLLTQAVTALRGVVS